MSSKRLYIQNEGPLAKIARALSLNSVVCRINEWCQHLPSGSGANLTERCFLLPEFLEGKTAVSESGENYPPLKPGWYRIHDTYFEELFGDKEG